MKRVELFSIGGKVEQIREEIHQMNSRIKELSDSNEKILLATTVQSQQFSVLSDIVERKMGELISVVAGKGMIPLDVFKWLVIFVIGFVFCLEFGIEGVSSVVKAVRP